MSPGDFVLTPSGTIHDHGNDSKKPMIWLDVLDVPTINFFETCFYEHFDYKQQNTRRDNGDSLVRYGSGVLPDGSPHRNSPIVNYPYAKMRPILERLAAEGDIDPRHGARFRYANPLTGGPPLGKRLRRGFMSPTLQTIRRSGLGGWHALLLLRLARGRGARGVRRPRSALRRPGARGSSTTTRASPGDWLVLPGHVADPGRPPRHRRQPPRRPQDRRAHRPGLRGPEPRRPRSPPSGSTSRTLDGIVRRGHVPEPQHVHLRHPRPRRGDGRLRAPQRLGARLLLGRAGAADRHRLPAASPTSTARWPR